LLAGCSTAEPASSFDLQMKGKKNMVSFDKSLKKTNFNVIYYPFFHRLLDLSAIFHHRNSQGRATAKKQTEIARSAWPLLFIPAVGYLLCLLSNKKR
jgi:hypothetical protein